MNIIFAAADRRLVAGVLVAVALTLIAIFMIASALASRRRRVEIPAALRPGPSDEELESRSLPRFLAVGSIFLLFMSFFLPAYWLREPTRIRLKAEQFRERSIERGKHIYGAPEPGAHGFAANCAACHGKDGEGVVQPWQEKYQYAEPPLRFIVSRYKAAGLNDDEIRRLIYDAIERGRPGTLMPTWGLAFGGPLNSEQVDDVVNYIYSIQEGLEEAKVTSPNAAAGRELWIANCQTCHTRPQDLTRDPGGPRVWGGVGPDLRTVMSQLTPTEIFNTIHDGRVNTNRPSMPSWAFLGDNAIRSLIEFLRSIQTGAIKPDEPAPSPSPSANPNPTSTGATS